MEIRTITEVRIYILVLNEMHNRAEYGRPVAMSTEYNNLVNYYNANLLEERFRDEDGYLHSFKEGPLFNFNPCMSLELNNLDIFGFGIQDKWINQDILEDIGNINNVILV